MKERMPARRAAAEGMLNPQGRTPSTCSRFRLGPRCRLVSQRLGVKTLRILAFLRFKDLEFEGRQGASLYFFFWNIAGIESLLCWEQMLVCFRAYSSWVKHQ